MRFYMMQYVHQILDCSIVQLCFSQCHLWLHLIIGTQEVTE